MYVGGILDYFLQDANLADDAVEAVGQEQSEALEVLKSSDELISASLRTELEATRKQLKHKVFELEQMKDQLMGVLVSKDKTQKRLDDALAAAAPNGQQQADEATPAKSKKEDAEKIEKLKTALKQKLEVSTDSSSRLASPHVSFTLGRERLEDVFVSSTSSKQPRPLGQTPPELSDAQGSSDLSQATDDNSSPLDSPASSSSTLSSVDDYLEVRDDEDLSSSAAAGRTTRGRPRLDSASSPGGLAPPIKTFWYKDNKGWLPGLRNMFNG